MRLVRVVDMSTAQPYLLNADHATLVAPIHLDTKTRVFGKDVETWAVTFVVSVGGTATVYATRRRFAGRQEALARIASLADVVD